MLISALQLRTSFKFNGRDRLSRRFGRGCRRSSPLPLPKSGRTAAEERSRPEQVQRVIMSQARDAAIAAYGGSRRSTLPQLDHPSPVATGIVARGVIRSRSAHDAVQTSEKALGVKKPRVRCIATRVRWRPAGKAALKPADVFCHPADP
jgi:hypothetical protein